MTFLQFPASLRFWIHVPTSNSEYVSEMRCGYVLLLGAYDPSKSACILGE